MSTLQFALIGCGNLGLTHAQCLSKVPPHQGTAAGRFRAYCDMHLPAAEKLCLQFSGDYACADPQQIFADAAIDAVYICTRHDSHAPLAIAAAKAGKHIFVEKPLALTMEQCERVAQAVAQAGVHLMPAFKMRYFPLIRRAHEFIPQPQMIVAQMMDARWGDSIWAQDPVQGGGNVHSQGCHTTDILRYLAGSEPQRIWAAGGALTHPGHPCIDQCVAAITMANGHVASWVQGDAGMNPYPSKFFFQLFGQGKSVVLYDRLKKATFCEGRKTWIEERPEEEGFQLENQEFVQALTEKRPPELSAHDGIQATRMVLAADAAIRTGQVQEL